MFDTDSTTVPGRAPDGAPPPPTAAEAIEQLLAAVGIHEGECGEPGRQVLLRLRSDGWEYVVTRTLVELEGPAPEPREPLSPRETEIARMVARGYTNKTIADVLDISVWTVGTHLRRIFTKLHVSSRAAMVAALTTVHHEPAWLADGSPVEERRFPSPPRGDRDALRPAPSPPR
jgi:DNA-binding CsgD family transcriptional regulator